MVKSKSESSNTENVPVKDLLTMYAKHVPSGAIFKTLQDPKNDKKVILRSKNKNQYFTQQQLHQGIVDGLWKVPNEHELRKHLEEENSYMEAYSYRLVKRIVFTQLLLELDSELMEDRADDKNIKSLLLRCENHFERLIKDHFTLLYNIDKEYLTNFMNGIERVVTKMAKLQVHEFLIIDKMLEEYLVDPEKFTPEVIEMVKIDGDLADMDVDYETVEPNTAN